MRRFDRSYLETTRRGMWTDDREALADLELADRESVLDVGCGTGVLTRVLREEATGTVVGVDADRDLLSSVDPPVAAGDATRLPFRADAVDLVVCQALLINLPDPVAAVAEFARVATDAVAAVEPDNAAVSVESSVAAEPPLARRARRLYLQGVGTDAALGAGVAERFEAAELEVVSTRRYDHVRRIGPPYSEDALDRARRMATGDALADDRAELLASDASAEEVDGLRQDWRSMGRAIVEQMKAGEYERIETVPFYVTVGRVPE